MRGLKTTAIVVASVLVILAHSAFAQTLRIDWSARKAVTSSAESAGDKTVIVTGINDYFYTYLIDVTPIPQSTGDLDRLLSLQPVPTPPIFDVNDCAGTAAESLNAALEGLRKISTPKLTSGQYTSIPLSQTQQEWRDNVKSQLDKITNCPTAPAAVKDSDRYKELLANQNKLLGPLHELKASFTAKQCFDYQIKVTEQYSGVNTQQALPDNKLGVECDQLTVSGGTLLTAIQNRSYNSRALPSQTGQFLAVDGTGSLRPIVLALLNYNLPKLPGTWGQAVRFAVSTGPAFQSTGKSDVSKFGFFLGASVSLYKRIYLTPGVHWGEFADFPLGFVPGQQIPANFGELTPVKRNTARFALGITLQALDVSKLFHAQPTTPSVTPKP